MLNKVQGVQECDARMLNSNSKPGSKEYYSFHFSIISFVLLISLALL
ncbi:hypothetical protein BH10BAC2_BH10BAC2_26620 [soil metagenome]